MTSAKIEFETTFDKYFLEFENAYKAADLLRKHDLCSMEDILVGTEEKLRRPLFEFVRKREFRREKRRFHYETKVTRHPEL